MSRWLHLLCWLALAAGAVAAEPGMLLEGKATAVARDRDATLWSIDGSGGNVIATLDGARWLSHAVVGLNEHVRPVSLATLPDGDVGCLWEDHSESDDSWAVTRHRAGKSWLWVRFHATLRDPALLGRRDGSAIVTESGRSVVLLAADANPATVTTLAKGNFVTPKKNDDGSESSDFAPVRAVEDRSGCLWLWNPGQVRQSWKWHLAGLVRWDPASPAERLCRIGKGEPPISQVVAWDEQRIALAVAGTGPFFAPNDGSKFEPMPTPDADAFRYVEQFFHDGSAWHAVTTPQPTDYKVENSAIQSRIAFRVLRFYDVSKPVCALWKYSDEHWSRIFDGLDKDPAASPRPWLRMATGLFLGSDQSAPWFFPAAPEAKPRRLASAHLFPLPRTAQMA